MDSEHDSCQHRSVRENQTPCQQREMSEIAYTAMKMGSLAAALSNSVRRLRLRIHRQVLGGKMVRLVGYLSENAVRHGNVERIPSILMPYKSQIRTLPVLRDCGRSQYSVLSSRLIPEKEFQLADSRRGSHATKPALVPPARHGCRGIEATTGTTRPAQSPDLGRHPEQHGQF